MVGQRSKMKRVNRPTHRSIKSANRWLGVFWRASLFVDPQWPAASRYFESSIRSGYLHLAISIRRSAVAICISLFRFVDPQTPAAPRLFQTPQGFPLNSRGFQPTVGGPSLQRP
jgi:hypothetical protein